MESPCCHGRSLLTTGCYQFWHLLQKLESGMADVISLDGGRISSKGITSGSGFRVAPLAEAPSRFGSSAPSQAANPADLQQQVRLGLSCYLLHPHACPCQKASVADSIEHMLQPDSTSATCQNVRQKSKKMLLFFVSKRPKKLCRHCM